MIQAQDSHKMPGGFESPMFPDTAAEKIDPGVGRPRVHSSILLLNPPSQVQIHTLLATFFWGGGGGGGGGNALQYKK